MMEGYNLNLSKIIDEKLDEYHTTVVAPLLDEILELKKALHTSNKSFKPSLQDEADKYATECYNRLRSGAIRYFNTEDVKREFRIANPKLVYQIMDTFQAQYFEKGARKLKNGTGKTVITLKCNNGGQ